MRLIRLVIGIWLLTVAFIGSAVWYGRTYAEPNKLPAIGLDTCKDQPCYAGIVPNTMTYDDTMRILNRKRGLPESSPLRGVVDESNRPVRYVHVFVNKKSMVFEIDLILRQGALPVGDLIQRLGQPCAVYPLPLDFDRRYPYTVVLAYPQLSVYVNTYNVNWRMEPTSHVGQIELGNPYDAQPFDRCQGDNGAVRYDWKGLGSYPRP